MLLFQLAKPKKNLKAARLIISVCMGNLAWLQPWVWLASVFTQKG